MIIVNINFSLYIKFAQIQNTVAKHIFCILLLIKTLEILEIRVCIVLEFNYTKSLKSSLNQS